MSERPTAENDVPDAEDGFTLGIESDPDYFAEIDAPALVAARAVADRWTEVLDECKAADPRWVLDRSVTTLETCLNELRRALDTRDIPPERSVIWEDHERDMQDPEYRKAFEEATRVIPPERGEA